MTQRKPQIRRYAWLQKVTIAIASIMLIGLLWCAFQKQKKTQDIVITDVATESTTATNCQTKFLFEEESAIIDSISGKNKVQLTYASLQNSISLTFDVMNQEGTIANTSDCTVSFAIALPYNKCVSGLTVSTIETVEMEVRNTAFDSLETYCTTISASRVINRFDGSSIAYINNYHAKGDSYTINIDVISYGGVPIAFVDVIPLTDKGVFCTQGEITLDLQDNSWDMSKFETTMMNTIKDVVINPSYMSNY